MRKPVLTLWDDWYYVRIKVGNQFQNILLQKFYEMVQQELQELLYGWYFLRYFDSAPEVRLRFNLRSTKDQGVIHGSVMNLLASCNHDFHFSQVSVEYYYRETVRYNPANYPVIERIFMLDTKLFESYLGINDVSEVVLTGAWRMYQYLKALYPDDNELSVFVNGSIANFRAEFENTEVNKEIVRKHLREYGSRVCKYLEGMDLISDSHISELSNEIQNLSVRNTSIDWSLIHMSMNRHFPVKQRPMEFLTYNLVSQYLKYKRKVYQHV